MRWHVSVAFLGALLLQAGSAVWWAAGVERNQGFYERRITVLETGLARTDEGEGKIVERLARIEEREDAALRALDRIEKVVMAGKH